MSDRLPRLIFLMLLVLGVVFRFVNLDQKVYWHDEVYTSMRAGGWTRREIDQKLFQNQIFSAPELQKFQQLKPGSTASSTIYSLAVEDPQHPPLYFLMARAWLQTFGSSLRASRSLAALLSLLALPLMYGLGLELFASRPAALLATALLAVSPFDVLFAQTARQYSLLTAAVIGSSYVLLRALRLKTWKNWGLYTLACALGLYTHPFMLLTLIGQGVYVGLLSLGRREGRAAVLKYLLAIAGALILYSPWLIVLLTNYQRAADTTSWTKASVELLFLVKLWVLSFTCLFFDLDVGFNNLWTYLLRLPVVLLIAAALYTVCRRTNRSTWLFIITSIVVPFGLLVLPDLVSGGKRSTVTRYLISCFPGIQLAVAYFLVTKLVEGRLWRGVMALLLTGSVISCTVSAFAETWWCKDLSYRNAEVARQINASSAPLVLSDIGDDFTNTGDLISLSYLLNDNVRLLLLKQPPDLEQLNREADLFVFRPSGSLSAALGQDQWMLELLNEEGRLFRVKRS